MTPPTIAAAIIARIKADSTLYNSGTSAWQAALIGGAFYEQADYSTAAFPNVVFIVRMNWAGHFSGMGAEFEVDFSIRDLKTRNLTGLDAVYLRLIGDMAIASGTRTVPTYGFHNHKLVIASPVLGEVASEMSITGESILEPESDTVVRATLTFKGLVSNVSVNQ